MQFEELWIVIVDKNPKLRELEDTSITMTVRGFKKALKLAYEQGLNESSIQPPTVEETVPFEKLFGGIFNNRKQSL